MKQVVVIASVVLSCVLCLLLGSYMLLHGDFYFLSDQARDYALVKSIVLDHKLTLIGSHSGLGGLFHGPLWLYLLSPVFFIGQGNPISFAYFYVLVPLMSIIVGFSVGKKLYGNSFGMFVSFLLATNAILWSYIPNTIGINMMPLLYLLFIYSAVSYIRGQKNAFIPVVYLAGLSFQFETASAIALIPVVICIFFLGSFKKMQIKTVLLSLIGGLISLITFILFDIRHRFLIFISTLQLFNQHDGHKDYANLLQRVLDHVMAMKNTYMSVLFGQSRIEIVLAVSMLGYFCYIFWKKKGKTILVKEFLFLLFTPLIVYLFYVLYPHPIYGEYVLDLVVSIIFASAFMMHWIVKEVLGKVLVGLFLFFTCISIGQYLQAEYVHPYVADASAGSYQNQKRVVDWVYEDAKGKQFGYFVYTPETFTYGMDYLFWWVSARRHLQVPLSQKLSTTYLIMYPGLANDLHAHEYWKQHTLNTQVIPIETKTFRGGIVVEKIDLSKDSGAVDPNYYQNLIFR